MHPLYFTALFAALHSLAFPMNVAARTHGINCHGSAECSGHPSTTAYSLVSAIMGIDPNQQYNNGEEIACQILKSAGRHIHICAFLQHMQSGATGKDIQRLAHYITDHGCTACGSVPFNFPSDNDNSKGELTFNYVARPIQVITVITTVTVPALSSTTLTTTVTVTAPPPSTSIIATTLPGPFPTLANRVL